jgi:hypothetical protein
MHSIDSSCRNALRVPLNSLPFLADRDGQIELTLAQFIGIAAAF